MLPKPMIVIIAALALVSLACGVSINLPVTKIQVGPTQTEEITVPSPDSPDTVTHLTLGFGAGELLVAPGAQAGLVQGTATYNVKELKPDITTNGNNASIETGDFNFQGIPKIGNDMKNTWDLKLGSTPMDLTINAGAYKGQLDLGGLAIQSLHISDGASDVRLSFSAPNLAEMDTLSYNTGASKVEMTGLANADFQTLIFKGGAGQYTLDFSGELKRDATATVDSGLSSFTIVVPKGVSARVFVDGGLANVDVSGAWDKSGNEYTLDGSGPRLTINVNIGAGSLTLKNN
jgi:hypothetical protein